MSKSQMEEKGCKRGRKKPISTPTSPTWGWHPKVKKQTRCPQATECLHIQTIAVQIIAGLGTAPCKLESRLPPAINYAIFTSLDKTEPSARATGHMPSVASPVLYTLRHTLMSPWSSSANHLPSVKVCVARCQVSKRLFGRKNIIMPKYAL